jgi:L-seryl-tRNA(Ser) seleniumtransferase
MSAALAAMAGWRATVVEGASAIGGGSAPGVELPTWLVALERDGTAPQALEESLRRLTPPIIARIEHDRVVLDPRTLEPEQDAVLLAAIRKL